jgi:hypothetical protein
MMGGSPGSWCVLNGLPGFVRQHLVFSLGSVQRWMSRVRVLTEDLFCVAGSGFIRLNGDSEFAQSAHGQRVRNGNQRRLASFYK